MKINITHQPLYGRLNEKIKERPDLKIFRKSNIEKDEEFDCNGFKLKYLGMENGKIKIKIFDIKHTFLIGNNKQIFSKIHDNIMEIDKKELLHINLGLMKDDFGYWDIKFM